MALALDNDSAVEGLRCGGRAGACVGRSGGSAVRATDATTLDYADLVSARYPLKMGAAEPHALLFFNIESHFNDRMDLVDDFRKEYHSPEPQLIENNVVSSRLSLRLWWERSTRYIVWYIVEGSCGDTGATRSGR